MERFRSFVAAKFQTYFVNGDFLTKSQSNEHWGESSTITPVQFASATPEKWFYAVKEQFYKSKSLTRERIKLKYTVDC